MRSLRGLVAGLLRRAPRGTPPPARSGRFAGPPDELGELLRALERELRVNGRLSFATCELMRDDPRLDGFESCLVVLGCAVFAARPDTPAIARRHRTQMCRVMLLALAAHTPAPAWTSFQLEQLVVAALQVPGAELSDLVQAVFAVLGETPGAATPAQAGFIRELAQHVIAARRRGHRADDFVWIAVRLADPVLPVTEAQAYLALHVLPRRLRGATRELILRTVTSPLADEVARTLAERRR
jgi:hypothetical protein